jgi:membrane fusion protein (multidrug efflux system)
MDNETKGRSAVAPEPGEIERLRDEVKRLREEQEREPKPRPNQKVQEPDEDEPPSHFLREHPIKALIGVLVVICLLAGIAWYWQYSQTFESTDDAQIDGHINAISSRVSGTVTKVHVQENQEVQAGQLLVELDPRDYQVSLERAQANIAQAQAQVRAQQPSVPITSTSTETAIASARADIANAEAGVAVAEQQYQAQLAQVAKEEANNQKAQADLERYTALVKKDEISRQEYDQRVAAAKSAQAAVESERAAAQAAQRVIEQRKTAVTLAEAQLGELTANAPGQVSIQRATLALQHANVEGARASAAEARLALDYTKIYAPVSGVIGRKSVEIGMRVQPGQELLSIVPLNDIWVTANFKENQLKKMKPGQRATIHVDALGRDLEGYVESLPAATAARYSILPPENASGNYVKVVQRLPIRLRFKDPKSAHGELRPGMSVVPKVWFN